MEYPEGMMRGGSEADNVGCVRKRCQQRAGTAGQETTRVDWDGVGTFALFISSGAIGVAVVALLAYKARLASKLEWARLGQHRDTSEADAERIHELEVQVQRLTERVDFTEKLLGDGKERSGTTPEG